MAAHFPVLCTQTYGEQSDDEPALPAALVVFVEVCELEQTDPPVGLQARPVQPNPDTQSLVVVQFVLHAAPTHAKLPAHGVAASGAHVPVPSHLLVTSFWSLLHEVLPHVVPDAAYWQACSPPLAVHVAPHVVPAPAHAARGPCGSPFTCEHRPRVAATSHAWHCLVQAALQQKPSTQKPVSHWSPAAHAAPLAKLPEQIPAKEQLLLAHWRSSVQEPPLACAGTHALPLQ